VRAAWAYLVQECDRLIQGHRFGWAAFLAFGEDDQAGDVAADLVTSLSVADRAFQDLVDQPERPVGQFLGTIIHPLVQVVGRELLELGGADVRGQVVVGDRPVVVDRGLGLALHPVGEEVIHRLLDGVAVGCGDAGLQVLDDLAELVLDLSLGPALALDSLASASYVEAEA
jgi:hypothetical protein